MIIRPDTARLFAADAESEHEKPIVSLVQFENPYH
jgi:hypothetical protein